MYDIDEDTGLPVEDVSCAGCGMRYGAYRRKVCVSCHECSACCMCQPGRQILMASNKYIRENIL